MTLRIGYVLDRYPVLSQTFIANEIAELRAQGAEVHVVALEAGDRPGADDGSLIVRNLQPTTLGDRLQRKLLLSHPGRRRRFVRALDGVADELGGAPGRMPAWKLPAVARWLAHRRVDVLHAHFAWQAASAAWALAALIDRPWAMTVHANDIFARTRNLDAKLRATDVLVTVCEYNERYLQEELGLEREILRIVCGVAIPQESALIPYERRSLDVVAVGRLVEKKGFDTLIRAVALLRRAGLGLRLQVVGDGPEAASLSRLVAELEAEEGITFTGALPHEETLARVGNARCLALPARIAASGDRDSMPVVVKEAMARAVPVVASHVVGIPEMVDPSCGVLVPPDDHVALAAGLARVLTGGRGAELGRAGRQRAAAQFALAGEVARLHQALRAVADGAPAARVAIGA